MCFKWTFSVISDGSFDTIFLKLDKLNLIEKNAYAHRHKRILSENGTYHVMMRGNEKRTCF
ncbi:Uncharacterized [Syntrophomonas zehnderi OL-4]|uniref:Uncharacterized n=1 Tax=Syntrophomonas zehnderi OL-4 TaxID=690567 RepID=A0A0E3W3F2_9FIRM|nr:hypothetical protein [Syntrophomonas zehnderi]CFX77850.1 Uncharacterized [Syntrophomonas zehnderi OL-4]